MRRYLLRELTRALARLAVAFGLFGLVSRIPWPAETVQWIGIGTFVLLAVAVLVTCGTFLYDTLFFDRYWRQMDSR